MARKAPDGLKVLTANRLRDGAVVYLTDSGAWSEDIRRAAATDDPERQKGFSARVDVEVARRVVVGPYFVPVTLDGDAPCPLSQRERIRADGPTVAFGWGRARHEHV